jgi:ArsR family transcriptional regulator
MQTMTDLLAFAKTMADETRQQIMQILCCRELCVTDVVETLAHDGNEVSQPTVSHHLNLLREAGLVTMRRDGRQVYYSLNQDAVAICCGVILQRFAPEQEIWSLQPHQALP